MLLNTAVDLFAGCGGTTEGATQAGLDVLMAANHLNIAVDTHARNHPKVKHVVQDLCQANFHSWDDHDLMLASPACQGHTNARGKERAHHDSTRSTAWAAVACAEAKRPKALIVENVPEFQKWTLFPQWKSCLEALGYLLSFNVLNAADVGVPQSRVRLFVVGVRRDYAKEAVTIPQGRHPHVPAWTILDHNADNWSLVNKEGRSPATLARIARGREQFGSTFLMAYYGSEKSGRDLNKPLGTIVTKDRFALVDGDRMRMLTKLEYLRGQGFRDDYLLPDDHSTSVHLIGNAVAPPQASWVITQLNKALSN